MWLMCIFRVTFKVKKITLTSHGIISVEECWCICDDFNSIHNEDGHEGDGGWI